MFNNFSNDNAFLPCICMQFPFIIDVTFFQNALNIGYIFSHKTEQILSCFSSSCLKHFKKVRKSAVNLLHSFLF